MQAHQNDEQPGNGVAKAPTEIGSAANCPATEALAPSVIKTVENPSTKHQRRKKGAALLGNRSAVPIGQLIKRGPGNEAQIGRHQRQNAGAQKTDGARHSAACRGTWRSMAPN